MADTQSVAKAQADLDKATAEAAKSKAALDAAQNTYNDLRAKRDAALEAWKSSGAGQSSPEYEAYKAARSAATDANSVAKDAQTVYEADLNSKAQAADALTAAQKAVDTASSQTASDAVADKTANPATTTQTATTSNPVTQNTGTDSSGVGAPLSATEQQQVSAGNNQQSDNPNGKSIAQPLATDQYKQIPAEKSEDSYTFAPKLKTNAQVGFTAGTDILNVVDSINPNPLSAYASYTYNLNLHILTADDYHNMVNDPTNFVPSRNLISGANKYNATYNPNNSTDVSGTLRDPAFTDDFYFDELKMKTIIGLNAVSGASNAIEINFTIIEPYGMTLMNRILDINNNELDVANYLEMPYLLEINFFGADDFGKLQQIPDTTKFIPIKIIGFKIKANTKGSEYTVQAVPFNHQANFASFQDIKANFGVTADTVGKFFSSTALSASQQAAVDKTFDETARQSPGKGADSEPPSGTRSPSSASATSKSINLTSLTEAVNAWNRKLATDGNVDYSDKINFVIDDVISNSSITDPAKNDVGNTKAVDPVTNAKSNSAQASGSTLPDPQTTYNATPAASNTGAYFGNPHVAAQGAKAGAQQSTGAGGGRGGQGGPTAAQATQNTALANPNSPDANTVDFGSSMFHLNAGTKILQIIDMVMMNSQYILNQLQDPTIKNKSEATSSPAALAEANGVNQVQWYKIVPEVQLDKYDHTRNVWGKIITYNIQAYTYYNNRHPDMPKTPPPPAVKNYQYIYTGQNTEVITFDIDFNALYFTSLQANRGNTTDLTDTKDQPEGNASKPAKPPAKVIDPQKIGYKGGSAPGSSSLGSVRAEVQAAHNVLQSFYSQPNGDMIQLKLQILGDPQFIKQDDIYYSPRAITKLNLRGNQIVNGSLASDNGELFCTCVFKTPVDIDEVTGLLRKDSKYNISYFSGYYRVLSVDSEFRNGKFTQTLELIRYDSQGNPGQAPPAQSNYDAERNDNASTDAQNLANPAQPGGAQNVATVTQPITPLQTPALAQQDDDAYNQINSGGIIKPPPQVLPGQEVPQQDENLKAVAEKGETKTIDQATSADANTVPVQSTNVPEANQAMSQEQARTQINELSNANAELLAQNRGLQVQNSNLNPDDPAQASQMAQNRAQIAQNKATMLANGNKASELDSKYKLYQTSVITSKDGTVINLS